MLKEKLVLIGNGMAGVRVMEELLQLGGAERYQITVFGAEPHPSYNRILLSPVLAGEQQVGDIITKPLQWFSDHGISLHIGDPVVGIDRVKRQVTTAAGTKVGYDRLIIATGSRPHILPLPGAELEGVLGFREIVDVNRMLAIAGRYRRAVVIGGGLLGLEAAYGLLKQGMQVTVVHRGSSLMGNQLDQRAATLLQASLEQQGIGFLMEKSTREILGTERVSGVCFTDGERLETDLVVMATGTQPNIELAQAAGIYCQQGIVVSDTMQTYDPRIYAVGECVQHRGSCYGLVVPVFEQASVCANHIAEMGYRQYPGTITATTLKVAGIELFSAGNFRDDEHSDPLVYSDPARGIYKKLVIKDNRVAGAVLYGDAIDGGWYFRLMQSAVDISSVRDSLLFGQAYAGAVEQHDELADVC